MLEGNVYEGVVNDYEKEEDKLTLYLKGDYFIVATYYGDYDVSYGDKVKLKGEYKEVTNPTIPYAFSYRNYLKNKDIDGVFSIEEIKVVEKGNYFYSIKNWVKNRIEKIDEKGYILAFILGDKHSIDEEMYTNYSKIGVTHLFALSGMHVGVLSGILFFFFKRMPKGKYFISSIFLIFYGILVGFPSSLKRCIFFFLLNILNKIFHLKISPLRLLLLVFIGLLLFNYKIIFDIGFLFSFVTVYGILLFSKSSKDSNKFISSLKVSIIAFLFSLPITLSSFYSINFLSILYNLFYIPFVSLFLYPMALLTFLFPFLYPIFSFFLTILEHITIFLSKIDFLTLYLSFTCIYIGFYYFFLFLFYKTKKIIFVFLSCFLVLFKIILPYFDSNGYIYFFDVGQGDSCLVITPYRKDIIMIDTGGVTSFNKKKYYVSDNIITFLKHEGIKKINYLILSHGNYDHMGDTIYLANNMKIEKVILNCGPYNDLENKFIKLLNKKDIEYYSCIEELHIESNKLYFLK